MKAFWDTLETALIGPYQYNFDHVASVIPQDTLAVRWMRLSPALSADRYQAHRKVHHRVRFQLSSIHQNIFELYDFTDRFGLALEDHFTIEGISDDALEAGRVVISIDARLTQALNQFRKEP